MPPANPYHSVRYAHEYDIRWRRYNRCTSNLLRTLLSEVPGTPQQILDVGCGTGNGLAILHQQFPEAQIVGLDPSEVMLNVAQGKRLANVRLQQGVLRDLGVEQYDLITSMSMFHYVQEPEQWLQHIRSHLAPGGHVVLVDWDASGTLLGLRRWWLLRQPHIAHVYNQKELEALLRQHFSIVDARRQACCRSWWSFQGYVLGMRNHEQVL